MKHYCKIIRMIGIALWVILVIVACSSKEDKIANTIKNDMFKSLSDFESYEPIETKIDSLRNDVYGDTLIFDNTMKIAAAIARIGELDKMLNEQKEEIYSLATYEFPYSAKKIKEIDREFGKNMEEKKENMLIVHNLSTDNKEKAKKCDGNHYGWLVTHKFRCKTKVGNPELVTAFYFIDKDGTNIIRKVGDDYLSYDTYKFLIDESLKNRDQ